MTPLRIFTASLLILLSSPFVKAQQELRVPHIDIYFLCQTNDLASNDTALLEQDLVDLYLGLVPDATDASLQVESTIDGCLASDVVEVDISSDGSLLSTDSLGDLTAEELQGMITRDLLKDQFKPLCNNFLAFEASVQEADSEPDGGLTSRISSTLCGLSDDGFELTAALIAGIAAGALVIICFLFFCCCCRRGK